MRNVNVDIPATISTLKAGFILTMRNVNEYFEGIKSVGEKGFILTMRNVNNVNQRKG